MLEKRGSEAAPPGVWWWQDSRQDYSPLEGDVAADVVIVGAGITGITLAHTLAVGGASVIVLEAGRVAGSASGRNAGFLLAAPAEPYGEAVAMWGRAGARAMLEIGRRTHERVHELVETLGIECEYRRTGSVRLARTEEEAEDQRASLPLMRADGFPVTEVPVATVMPGGPHERFDAAFVTDEDGEFHPVRFVHGLARVCEGRGVRLHAHSEVEAAHWGGSEWEARTARGVARARTLVIATNAYAPGLCPALAPLIAPRRAQMLFTARLEREVVTRPTCAHWGYQYWRQTPQGRLLIGGWRDLDLDGEAGFGEGPTSTIQNGLESGLRELVPEGVEIEGRWAGIMGFARDGRPLVGWLDAEHHLAIAAGYTGHGIGMAAACTQDLALLLAFRPAPGIATFDPARFPELRRPESSLTSLGASAPRTP
ncbi:MAG: FAD-binding oxidoreductase [Candidatus Eisenbacteria bacterium]|nr:FAD-binding oxidoreductase [Candidatus Eisenbacteria bacterium]